MKSLPKVIEFLLDEEIEEQEFVDIINRFYKQDCYIYAVIPEWEEELLTQLSDDFIPIKIGNFKGIAGVVKDSKKQYVYEFYLRSATMDFLIFSEWDLSRYVHPINEKKMDLYHLFETNKVPHITIGPDGQWLNIMEY